MLDGEGVIVSGNLLFVSGSDVAKTSYNGLCFFFISLHFCFWPMQRCAKILAFCCLPAYYSLYSPLFFQLSNKAKDKRFCERNGA